MCNLTKIFKFLLQTATFYGIILVRLNIKDDNMNKKPNEIKLMTQPKTKAGLSKMTKLIEAAEELFTEKGFYQTSIADICKRAGTAVGTFYIYFESKTDIYNYMMKAYEADIKEHLSEAIQSCSTRYEREREGIKGFIKYAVENPSVYNVVWGSLAVDRELFQRYYVSFANGYARALAKDEDELSEIDVTAVSYMLMGITNFLGLKAIFENMSDEDIDKLVDETLMPFLSNGIFKH